MCANYLFGDTYNNMRIANIIEDGRLAGPQLRILAVAKALKEYKIDTTVIHPKYNASTFSERLDAAGIHHVDLPLRTLSKGLFRVLNYVLSLPFELFLLYRLFSREKYDIIHCSGGAWQIKGIIAAWLSGTKVIWHINDTAMPSKFIGFFNFVANRLADLVIVAGQSVKVHYGIDESSRFPVVEIQAPVDCKLFDPMKVSGFREYSSQSGLNIVTVANVNPLKGLEHFIDMAEILSDKYHELKFHIIGPIYDSQKCYYEKLLCRAEEANIQNLVFHGQSNNIKNILKSSDIYVCSSNNEASPTSLWEAMAMEKAIVSTDVADVSRYLIDGKSGFVAKTKTGASLAEFVDVFVQDSELRKICGIEARKIAIRNFEISRCAKKHAKAYHICESSAYEPNIFD